MSPAAFRMRTRRSDKPPGWLSNSPVGRKAVPRLRGGYLLRRGGVTDCQVPPFAMQRDSVRVGNQRLALYPPVCGVVQPDNPLVVEQPPVVVQRQPGCHRPASWYIADLLARAVEGSDAADFVIKSIYELVGVVK